MATASNNGANRATRRAKKGTEMSTNPTEPTFQWLNDETRFVAMPSNPTAWLRRKARRGAVIVTDKHGNRRAYLGAPTKWIDQDGHYGQANAFAPIGKRNSNGATDRDLFGKQYRRPSLD
jgi:hypothetical protein